MILHSIRSQCWCTCLCYHSLRKTTSSITVIIIIPIILRDMAVHKGQKQCTTTMHNEMSRSIPTNPPLAGSVTAASKHGLTETLQGPQHSETNADQKKQSFRSYWFVTKLYGRNRSAKYSEDLWCQFQHPALLTRDLSLQLLQG